MLESLMYNSAFVAMCRIVSIKVQLTCELRLKHTCVYWTIFVFLFRFVHSIFVCLFVYVPPFFGVSGAAEHIKREASTNGGSSYVLGKRGLMHRG